MKLNNSQTKNASQIKGYPFEVLIDAECIQGVRLTDRVSLIGEICANFQKELDSTTLTISPEGMQYQDRHGSQQ